MKKIVYTLIAAMSLINAENNEPLRLKEENIQQSESDYAQEVYWSQPVRFTLGATALTVSTYLFYYYLYKNSGIITKENWIHFKHMSDEDKEKMMQIAGAQLEAQTRAHKQHTSSGLTQTLRASIKSGSWWIISSLGYQIAVYAIMNTGNSLFNSIKKRIPTTGSLSWFIAERTDYETYMNLLAPKKMFIRNGALVVAETLINQANSSQLALVELLIRETEKIIGYLQYRKNHLDVNLPSTNALKLLLQNYIQNITYLVEKMIQCAQHQNIEGKTVIEAASELDEEIKKACELVKIL